jgi:hypothetical protein
MVPTCWSGGSKWWHRLAIVGCEGGDEAGRRYASLLWACPVRPACRWQQRCLGKGGGLRWLWRWSPDDLGHKAWEEILVPVTAGTGDGDACGCHYLVGASPWSFAIYLPRFAPEENLRSLGSGDGGALCIFLLFGGIISEPTFAWDQGWHVAEIAGQGSCVQFGNDDVTSKVWVAARASLVGLSSVSGEFSCASPCRCGVGAAVECHCGNDDGQLVASRAARLPRLNYQYVTKYIFILPLIHNTLRYYGYI